MPSADVSQTMGYWTEQDLPFWYGLARIFPVADRWFASCLGPGIPNRRFLISGTANGLTKNYIQTRRKPPNGTIFDLLNKYHISWSIFSENKEAQTPKSLTLTHQAREFLRSAAALLLRGTVHWQESRLLSLFTRVTITGTADLYRMSLLTRIRHVEPIERFTERARDGELPSVSFVDPNFSLFSGEPPQNVSLAESYVAQVVDAVMHGRDWEHTLLVVLHDCHGGYYDHVPTPAAVDPDEVGASHQADVGGSTTFEQLGFRVPAIIVSPYARPNYLSHNTYDHTSVLKLIETLWNLPPLTKRDAMAIAPLDALDLDNAPTFLQPPKIDPPQLGLASLGSFEPFRTDTFSDLILRLLLVTAYGAVGYLALLTKNAVVELVATYVVLLATVRLVIDTGFWRHWAFWQPSPTVNRRTAAYGTILALAVLTMFFTLFASGLHARGLFITEPSVGSLIPVRFLEMYVWNLIDAIPGLRITDTFDWKSPFNFHDAWGRSMLIVYRLLVLAPVIDFISEAIRSPSSQGDNGAGRGGG
jgi:phospholipase C